MKKETMINIIDLQEKGYITKREMIESIQKECEKELQQLFEEEQNQYRQEAIEWQINFENENYSWKEITEWNDYFYNIGKKYNLLDEFIENGIC